MCSLVAIVTLAMTHPTNEENHRASQEKSTLIVTKASSAIRLDGIIDERAWQDALRLELNYEFSPGENVAPLVRTEVFVTYDEAYVYIAAKAYDPDPSQLRVRFRDHDSAWSDDYIGVTFDTFNDERRAYVFRSSPLGAQIDWILDDVAGRNDESWDAIWNSAGRITDFGYEVEMAIPFNQIRFQATGGPQTWGLDIMRNYPRSQVRRIGLVPRIRGNNSYLSQIAKVRGFEGVSPGRNVELIPTFTASRTDERSDFPAGDLEEKESKTDLGLTARWGVTPNITLLGTVNPDFSQVEADVAQLDVNERFALNFPETRSFFLESSDFFDTQRDLVHTRSIVDPSSAVKLTGKQGNHLYGVIAARDDFTTIIMPGSQRSDEASFDLESTGIIGRYRYDFGRNSTVGLLFTDREADGYYNRVLALDTSYRLSSSDSLRFNVGGSQTRYNQAMIDEFGLDDRDYDDGFLFVRYDHEKRNWDFRAFYAETGEDFRADLGFMPRVNQRFWQVAGEYTWWGTEEDFYNQMELGWEYKEDYERDGTLLRREIEGEWEFSGALETEIELNVGYRTQFFNGVEFEQYFQSIEFGMRPTADVSFEIEFEHGDGIDFRHTRGGEEYELQGEISWNIGRHLFLEFDHELSIFDVEGGRLFTANQPQARFIYQIDRRSFFRAILQYTDVRRDPDLYSRPVEEVEQELFTQLLYSYKLNPQTVLFLGYSDNYFSTEDFSLTQTDRTFFFKVGYAWLY